MPIHSFLKKEYSNFYVKRNLFHIQAYFLGNWVKAEKLSFVVCKISPAPYVYYGRYRGEKNAYGIKSFLPPLVR